MSGDEAPVMEDAGRPGVDWPRSFRPTRIMWGESGQDGTITKSRQYMTMTLYPRVLYIFSDVVVYVLKNKRQEYLLTRFNIKI
jgi:hypothetical protein